MKQKTNNNPFISELKTNKLKKERMVFTTYQTNVLSKILNPHRYNDRNIYGQNDIRSMWCDTAFNTNAWPEYKKPVLITKETDMVTDFYEPLLQKMRTQYFDYAFHKHGYKNLQELKQLPQFDISKLCEQTALFKNIQFHTTTDKKNIAISYGMDIFTPCLPEYVIKLSINHMLYVKLIDKDIENDIYQYRFDDYFIDKQEIICTTSVVLTVQYDRNNQNIDWTMNDYTVYEEFLTQNIPDMKWSAQEINFWNDVFGIEYDDEMIEVKCPLFFDDSDQLCVDVNGTQKNTMLLKNQAALNFLQKSLRQINLPNLEIVDHGQKVENKIKYESIAMDFPKYLTAIALINIEMIQEKKDFILPEDVNTIKVGNLSIKTSNPLRLNIKVK